MAAAEVRTAWQRAANRCLVQEDAKRAPKLACCPSSTPQNDSESGSTTTVQDYFIPNIIPNRNSMNSILSPETKWWLQMQPNLGYHKDYICKQLSSLEDEVKSDMDAVLTNGDSLSHDSSDFVATKEDSFLKSPEIVSSVFMTQDSERKVKEMNTKSYSEHSLKIKRATEGCLHKEELLGQTADPFSLKRPEKTSLDLESPWAGTTKSEPWWRIADKDELSLLVSQKSSQHIENCDLPKPSQTVHVPTGKLDAGIYGANEYSDNTSSCGFDDKFFYSGVNMLHQSEKLHRHKVILKGNLLLIRHSRMTFQDPICWMHFAIPRPELGKLKWRPRKLTMKRNISSSFCSDKRPTFSHTDSGYKCCSGRTFFSSINSRTILFPPVFQTSQYCLKFH
ncbi:uncharacterized protein LOC141825495 isoform X2 [Curcuma longa]|uniref:uncharacterized protein LOC141825495 isoform X2 n=1 Tax=Curcuma longa TaxID=136217 RepID=UPI003D9DCF99